MKKRFFGILLMGAMVFASMSMFTSCKDYDDDIAKLQEAIDQNSKAISEIQNLIANGGVVTSVNPIENGVRITMSGNLGSFDITNGINGKDGLNGKDGRDGVDGKDGAQGPQGVAGQDGKDGKDGQNGKDGKDGTTWTIGEDGYWYQNNVKTEYFALGTTTNTTTTVVVDAATKYYVPNPNTGCFDIYQDGVKIESTTISFLGTGSITATMDENFLVLYGIAGALGPNNSVSIPLTTGLTSLVFMPRLYLDGIEAYEYKWIGSTILKAITETKFDDLSHHATITGDKQDIQAGLVDYVPNTNLRHYDRATKQIVEGADAKGVGAGNWVYGPVWPIEYHLNPATAAIDWTKSDPDFNVLEPDVVNFATRTSKAALGIEAKEKYDYWKQDVKVFGAGKDGNGNRTVITGIQIQNPDKLNPWPTDHKINPSATETTIALQMNNNDDTSERVTSDYALLVPTKAQLEGLIWNKKPQYIEPKDEKAADGTYWFQGGPGNQIGDEEGPWCQRRVHVWDSPEEALADERGAALELPAMDAAGVDLTQYLGIHYLQQVLLNRDEANEYELGTWAYGEEKAWGLHYEFELVEYKSSTNQTSDSRYACFTDWTGNGGENADWSKSETGVIVCKSVTSEGKTEGYTSLTSVDREPLVRVLVKNKAGQVLLDGYILLHITYTPDNTEIVMPDKNMNFNLCDAAQVTYTWSEFSRIILQDGLNNMQRREFDGFYWADCEVGTTDVHVSDTAYVTPKAVSFIQTADDHRYSYELKQFSEFTKNGGAAALTGAKKLGTILYEPNGQGTTNHAFVWTVSEAELEALTHHKADTEFPIEVSRYIRYVAKDKSGRNREVDNYNAPYPYVYVKLTLKITRDKVGKIVYEEKIDNYWYHYNTGAIDGWSGVLLDIEAPRDRESIWQQPWNSPVSYFLVKNQIKNTAKTFKYFFAPKDYYINTQSGTYRITAQHPTKQPNYNTIFCKYVVDSHSFNAAPGKWDWDETLETTLERCAIKYGDHTADVVKTKSGGAFDNTVLYAEKNNVYTPIAIITQPEQIANTPATYPGAGNIKLVHYLNGGEPSDNPADAENLVCYDVLNAIGYINGTKISNDNINEQLRAWIGVISYTKPCEVAMFVEQAKNDGPVATFLASWERPINVEVEPIKPALDANTTENFLYFVDYLKMYDWRGPESMGKQGYMYNEHQWFWAYYNIRKISIDLNPTVVETNMHQADANTFVKLANVTNYLHLYPIKVVNPNTATEYVAKDDASKAKTYPTVAEYGFDEFNLMNIADKSFRISSNNDALKAYMGYPGVQPGIPTQKALFGGFYYENLGGNVTVFDVRFPVTIWYEWGPIHTTLTWHIDTTHGH